MTNPVGVAGTGLAALLLALAPACLVSVGDEVGGQGGNTPQAKGGAANAGGGQSSGGGPLDLEDCASRLPEDNDTRETAKPLGDGASLCVRNANDNDWLYVDSPDDGKVHILELKFTPEATADVAFALESAEDGSSLGNDYTARGTSETLWATLAPGIRVLLRITDFSYPGHVEITASLTTEGDTHSPNQTKDTAAQIKVNEEVVGETHRAYRNANDKPFEDWFQVELAPGAHTISFTQVVSSQQVWVGVTNPRGESVTNGYARNAGALFDLAFDAKIAGTYFFRVADFNSGPSSFVVGKEPAHVSGSYAFTIVE